MFIWVVVYCLTKTAHFISMQPNDTVEDVRICVKIFLLFVSLDYSVIPSSGPLGFLCNDWLINIKGVISLSLSMSIYPQSKHGIKALGS